MVACIPPSPARVLLASALGLIAGFVDVICIVRYAAFAGLQTGNLVFIGRCLYDALANIRQDPTIYDPDPKDTLASSVGFHLAMLFSNFLGCVGFCILADCTKYPVLLAAPLVGLLSCLGGVIDTTLGGCKWAACFVSASLGAMNFISSPNTPIAGKLFAMTALSTGNLQKCAKMFWKAVTCHSFTPADIQATWIATGVVFATVFGAVLGGLALFSHPFDKTDTFPWLLVPVGAAQCAVILWHDYLLRPTPPKPTEQLTEPLSTVNGVNEVRIQSQSAS
eukprot:6190840-Pleurochrysis_carterae.AAC.3